MPRKPSNHRTPVTRPAAPPDPVLQAMSDEDLKRLWAQRPTFPVTAAELDWFRVAREVRYRSRFNPMFKE